MVDSVLGAKDPEKKGDLSLKTQQGPSRKITAQQDRAWDGCVQTTEEAWEKRVPHTSEVTAGRAFSIPKVPTECPLGPGPPIGGFYKLSTNTYPTEQNKRGTKKKITSIWWCWGGGATP